MINCTQINATPEIINYVNNFNTDEELLRSGGLPNNMLDRMAYGFSEEDIKTLNPNQLHVKWRDDMDNVKWEQERSGLSKVAWAKTINLSEPIDVIYEKNKFYIDDGHHRTYAAKILKKSLNVNLEIKMNPILQITPNLNYDEFHRCLFKQVKNNQLNEQLIRIKKIMNIQEEKDSFRNTLKPLLQAPNTPRSFYGNETLLNKINNAFTYTTRGTIKKTHSVNILIYQSDKGLRYLVEEDGDILAAAFVNDDILKGIITDFGYTNVGIGSNLTKFIKSQNNIITLDNLTSKEGEKLRKYLNELFHIKNLMGVNENMKPDEESQLYLDIISMDPDNIKYQKYKELLKQKFNIDYDATYGKQDSTHIDNFNLNDIKSQKDFLNFNNWLAYAKKISQQRGFIPMTQYQTPGNIDADKILTLLSNELEFDIIKKDYIETKNKGGDIAHVMGNTMYYSNHMDLYYILHELGHILNFKLQYNGLVNNPAYSPTNYGTEPGEAFAESFAIYFINPIVLKNWCPEVYTELNQIIPSKWKTTISKIL